MSPEHDVRPRLLPLTVLDKLTPETQLRDARLEVTLPTSDVYKISFAAEWGPPNLFPPTIVITSPSRAQRQANKLAEKDAAKRLLTLTYAMQDISGGFLKIDHIHGAISGREKSPITNVPNHSLYPDSVLHTVIVLTEKGFDFDDELTEIKLKLGHVRETEGPLYDRLSMYYNAACKVNPLQIERDNAILGNVGARWDIEHFTITHLPKTIPSWRLMRLQ